MNRILIVDDQEIKADFLTLFIKEHCEECEFFYATSYKQAMMNLSKKYDLILCDYFLGDFEEIKNGLGVTIGRKPNGMGDDFIVKYVQSWPDALIFLYSAEPEHARETSIGNIRCYSFESVQTEILLAIGDFNDHPKLSAVISTEPKKDGEGGNMKIWIPALCLAITFAVTGVITTTKSFAKTDSLDAKVNDHCEKQEKKELRTDEKLDKMMQMLTRIETKLESEDRRQ